MEDAAPRKSTSLPVRLERKSGGDEFKFDPRELIPVPIVFCDANGWVLWLNQASETLTGSPAHQFIGNSFADIFPEDDRTEIAVRILRWYKKGDEHLHLETPIRSHGKKRWVGIFLKRIWTANGKNLFVASISDLQAMHDRVESLRRKVDELEARVEESTAAVQLKSEFVQTISEDVRTPMNGIVGMSNMLLETNLDPEQQTFVEVIENSGETLLQVVDDLLDFSRIEAGHLEIESFDFDLHVAIEGVVGTLGNRAMNRGVEFTYSVDQRLPHALKGDPGRLRQVLLNLGRQVVDVSNQGVLELRFERLGETARDIELGITFTTLNLNGSDDSVPVLFEAFARSDASLLQGMGSQGLGINLSRQVLSLMRGEPLDRAENDPVGTFRFRIPFEKQIEVDTEMSTHEDSGVSLTDARILIAEPSETNRAWLADCISGWGCRVTPVGDGTEVMQVMDDAAEQGEPFHLAIIDYDLTGIEVDSLAKSVRSSESLQDTILMMVTNFGRRGDADRAQRLGYFAYLLKPIAPIDLKEAFTLSLRRYGMARTDDGITSIITRHSLAEMRKQEEPAAETLLPAEDETGTTTDEMTTVKTTAETATTEGTTAEPTTTEPTNSDSETEEPETPEPTATGEAAEPVCEEETPVSLFPISEEMPDRMPDSTPSGTQPDAKTGTDGSVTNELVSRSEVTDTQNTPGTGPEPTDTIVVEAEPVSEISGETHKDAFSIEERETRRSKLDLSQMLYSQAKLSFDRMCNAVAQGDAREAEWEARALQKLSLATGSAQAAHLFGQIAERCDTAGPNQLSEMEAEGKTAFQELENVIRSRRRPAA